MIGLDTGFFFKLLKGNHQATEIFKELDDDTDLCVSCLTIFELKRLSLRGALEQDAVNKLIDNIMSLCHISWLNNIEIHDVAAGLSHGLGIPAVDSLILAGFVLNGSETIYTTDSHMEKYVKKGVQVIKL
jgi:predicted nucleic acid-binding protein